MKFRIAVTVALASLAAPASADIAEFCADPRGVTPELRVEACAKVLSLYGGLPGVRVDTLINLGLAYTDLQQYDRALSRFSDALRIASSDDSPAIKRVRNQIRGYRIAIYLKTDRFENAVSDYDLVINPDSPEAINLAGRCWARAVWGKQLEEGLADCERALQQSPHEADALRARALIRFRRADYANAVRDCQNAIEAGDHSPDVFYLSGIAKNRVSDPSAKDDLARAKDQDPGIEGRFSRWGLI